jgi:hypothetical protein
LGSFEKTATAPWKRGRGRGEGGEVLSFCIYIYINEQKKSKKEA